MTRGGFRWWLTMCVYQMWSLRRMCPVRMMKRIQEKGHRNTEIRLSHRPWRRWWWMGWKDKIHASKAMILAAEPFSKDGLWQLTWSKARISNRNSEPRSCKNMKIPYSRKRRGNFTKSSRAGYWSISLWKIRQRIGLLTQNRNRKSWKRCKNSIFRQNWSSRNCTSRSPRIWTIRSILQNHKLILCRRSKLPWAISSAS